MCEQLRFDPMNTFSLQELEAIRDHAMARANHDGVYPEWVEAYKNLAAATDALIELTEISEPVSESEE